MSWCAVFGCNSNGKRDKDITFFSLPSDAKLRNQWITMIKRTELPKRVYVCSKHFEESCFDPSWKMQVEMLGGKIKRKLLPGSVPTLFSYKQKPHERSTSMKRKAVAEKKEVLNEISISFLNIFFIFEPCFGIYSAIIKKLSVVVLP